MTVKVFAPAKINLALHVTGQRSDGYHLLDSLVVFAPVGDVLTIEPAASFSLTINGPEAGGLADDPYNLVRRAAEFLDAQRGARIALTKTLPVSSGIGGGSADAAAALRGLSVLWGREIETASHGDLAALGADVPMCMKSVACRVRGIGEQVEPVAALPAVPGVLVNPRVPVSTPMVFARLKTRNNLAMPENIPAFPDLPGLVQWLSIQRNDLQDAALEIAPEIGNALRALGKSPANMLSRMSGSGATCFGIFPDLQSARHAADRISRDHPGWWVSHGNLGDQSRAAQPLIS